MSDYYTHGTFPQNNTRASSATMRQELDAVSAGFDKLPTNPVSGAGWSDPVVVGAATADTHAVQRGQMTSAIQVATDSVLPVQVGNSGKFLKTNGGTPAWELVPDNSIAMAIALG